jgi:hypothetical protein
MFSAIRDLLWKDTKSLSASVTIAELIVISIFASGPKGRNSIAMPVRAWKDEKTELSAEGAIVQVSPTS